MTYYEKYVERVKYNSREALKDRAFYRRLEKDYNSETVYKENDKETPISAIIQTSQLSARYDYKKIALPLSTSVKTGDILFSNIGTVGNSCLVEYDREFSVKNMIIFKPETIEKSMYLYYKYNLLIVKF